MKWTTLGKHYGLLKPFDFRVAIPFLLNVLGMTLVLIAGIVLLATGGLRIGTERFYFLVYIIILFLAAAAFSRARIIALVIFFWCTTEVGLALAYSVSEQRFGPLYPPLDMFTEKGPSPSQFVYHPYLQFAPRPNIQWKGYVDMRNRKVFAVSPKSLGRHDRFAPCLLSSDNSPSSTRSAMCRRSTIPCAARIPRAMGRSKAAPDLRIPAGARFTINFVRGM